MKVDIPKELVNKVDDWVKQGRYKTIDEFIKAAIETLLMAERMKDSFTKSIALDSRKDV